MYVRAQVDWCVCMFAYEGWQHTCMSTLFNIHTHGRVHKRPSTYMYVDLALYIQTEWLRSDPSLEKGFLSSESTTAHKSDFSLKIKWNCWLWRWSEMRLPIYRFWESPRPQKALTYILKHTLQIWVFSMYVRAKVGWCVCMFAYEGWQHTCMLTWF